MLFAADIGNSCIDIGLFDEAGNLKMKSKISSVGSRTVDEYTVVISGLLAANGFLPDAITDGIVSSVVPGLTAVIKSAVKKLSDISFVEVGPGTKNGLKIRIDVQTQLGADIVANAVAATSEYRTPVIIIDVGTVTTITAVDADGVLEGVIISPGLKVSLDAMADAASGLNDVSLGTDVPSQAGNRQEYRRIGLFGRDVRSCFHDRRVCFRNTSYAGVCQRKGSYDRRSCRNGSPSLHVTN